MLFRLAGPRSDAIGWRLVSRLADARAGHTIWGALRPRSSLPFPQRDLRHGICDAGRAAIEFFSMTRRAFPLAQE